MSITKISKIELIALRKHKQEIINLLHDSGITEIKELEKANSNNLPNNKEILNKELSKLEYDIAGLKFLLNIIKEYQVPEKKKLSFKEKLNNIFDGRLEIRKNKYDNIVKNFEYQTVIKTGTEYEKSLHEEMNKLSKAKDDIKILKRLEKLVTIPEKETENNIIFLGHIKIAKYDNFFEEINNVSPLTYIEKTYNDDKIIEFSLIYDKKIFKEIKLVLSKFDVKELKLPVLTTETIKTDIQNLTKLIEQSTKNINFVKKQLQDLTKNHEEIKTIYTHLVWKKQQLEAESEMMETTYTFILHAWVPSSVIKNITKEVSNITPLFSLTELDIPENEHVPTLLTNNAFVEPFESVSSMAGVPGYKEVDPSLVTLPFFVIFFGFCLTDAGYGLIIAISSFLLLKFIKIPKETKALITVMLWCGIATFIFGTIFGGWMGIELDTLPNSIIKTVLLKARLINPIEDPVNVLIISLILGVIHLLTGVALSMYRKIRDKKILDGLLDDGVWIVFIISIGLFIVGKMVINSVMLSQITLGLMLLCTVVLILTQGRSHKNIFLKAGSGILSLYGLVGYFSEMLSYSRLLALGLATSIIAMVVNSIAFVFKDLIPVLGWPVAIAILIAGHLFNLGLNALGSYIHSGRLHFVEFFPKFLENSGRKFKPFNKKSNLINIID